jgi:hypothetical protein
MSLSNLHASAVASDIDWKLINLVCELNIIGSALRTDYVVLCWFHEGLPYPIGGRYKEYLLSQVSEKPIFRAPAPLREGEAAYLGRVVCVVCVLRFFG